MNRDDSDRDGTYPGHTRFLPYLLNRTVNRLNAEFQSVLHERRMTLTHWRVLAFLCEEDGLGISALADRTATDQSTLSRALQKLERQGFCERRTAASDSRVVEVHVTLAGRRLFKEILPTALQLESAAVDGIPAAELDAMRATLIRILANLR